jgi:hypothetical protein
MTDRLQKLLDQAKRVVPSSKEKEEQRRSFAYGNTKIENPRITREMVDREAAPKQVCILDAFGSFEFDPGYDYKAERSR